jgi:hypothetical protein
LYAETEEGRSSGIVRCLLGTTIPGAGLNILGFLYCGSAIVMSGADAACSSPARRPKPLIGGTSKSLLLSPRETNADSGYSIRVYPGECTSCFLSSNVGGDYCFPGAIRTSISGSLSGDSIDLSACL